MAEILARARRFVVQRFPFSVVYLDDAELVTFVAVAHSKRLPGYWKGRTQLPIKIKSPAQAELGRGTLEGVVRATRPWGLPGLLEELIVVCFRQYFTFDNSKDLAISDASH